MGSQESSRDRRCVDSGAVLHRRLFVFFVPIVHHFDHFGSNK
jgi:hypothetical protein